jgi:hypothetical protein
MSEYSLTHLSDSELLTGLKELVDAERRRTAQLLVDLGQFDARRLYLQASHDSMLSYCVSHLHMDEDEAPDFITAARAARVFPVICEAFAEGKLHLRAIATIAPYLTPENVEGLMVTAANKGVYELAALLDDMFPRA